MNKSELIGDLALAMSKAQGEMAGAKKDSKGNYGKFADLASVWEAARASLSKNDLAVIQTTIPNSEGISVVTTLMHKTGQWISGELFLPALKKDPQGFGGAMTYCRRYALAAILGIAPEDDDGQGATDKMKQGAAKQPPPMPPAFQDLKPSPPKKVSTMAWETLSTDMQTQVQDIVDGVRAEFNQKGADAAYHLWVAETECFRASGEVEAIVGAMSRFPADERNAIKAVGEALKMFNTNFRCMIF